MMRAARPLPSVEVRSLGARRAGEAPDGGREGHAMIELLPDMPPGTVGFRCEDEIEREDYDEILAPALRNALETYGELRTLYLIDDLDEIEPGALWADARLGYDIGVKQRTAWRRAAIVTDEDWLARAARLFAWMIP